MKFHARQTGSLRTFQAHRATGEAFETLEVGVRMELLYRKYHVSLISGVGPETLILIAVFE